MKFSVCMHQFFGQYLTRIKGVEYNTIKAYRDVFTIFFPFAAQYRCVKVDSLKLEHLSFDLVLDFLDHLENQRDNKPRTRNQRLAALKSLAKMIRLMYPEHSALAETILNIPQKRYQKTLIDFLSPEEILKVFDSVDLKKKEGFRDYAILHLLSDSGARASEISTLNLDYFDPQKKSLSILGKGNRYRQIELATKTCHLIKTYIAKYRPYPRPLYKSRIFINQRREELTRHGIYRLCNKHLNKALPEKRFKEIKPVHSFRHSCAVNMLCSGKDITAIKNRLGHENIKTTMVYLRLDLSRKRRVQKKFIAYTQSALSSDPKMEKLLDWENKEDILAWLDSL